VDTFQLTTLFGAIFCLALVFGGFHLISSDRFGQGLDTIRPEVPPAQMLQNGRRRFRRAGRPILDSAGAMILGILLIGIGTFGGLVLFLFYGLVTRGIH